jgi:hypothetical protein
MRQKGLFLLEFRGVRFDESLPRKKATTSAKMFVAFSHHDVGVVAQEQIGFNRVLF